MTRKTKGQKEYMKLLQDPRWQKRRLSVFEQASWKCEWCGTGEVNLQVHHGYYDRGRLPWEYPDGALYCLCDNCHERAEKARDAVYRRVGLIHPSHHWELFRLLKELGELLQQDPEALVAAGLGYSPKEGDGAAA